MNEPVHQIGMTELYQEIRSLGDRLTEYINRQDVTSSTQNHRITELEKDFAELKSRHEAEEVRRSNTNFQIKMAFLTAFVFPIVVGVVIAAFALKGN